MSTSETQYQINRLAALISIAAIDLFAKYNPRFFESEESDIFCERLQDVIREAAGDFYDEQRKH